MTFVAVLVGGLVGTGLRLGIDALIPHGDDAFPWSTLVINVVGSFALGVLVARVWPLAPAWLRLGLGTGLLGSFTTFSAMALSLLTLTQHGHVGIAVGYLAASLVLGLAAAALGLRFGHATPTLEPDE
jgi:CrcB protein